MGDEVFGLDFFVVVVVVVVACGKLEFDDDEAAVAVVVAVNVVIASGCTDIDATGVEDCVDDDFCCKTFADVSITFATMKERKRRNININIKFLIIIIIIYSNGNIISIILHTIPA